MNKIKIVLRKITKIKTQLSTKIKAFNLLKIKIRKKKFKNKTQNNKITK
jgi:hypothetical protein